MMYIVSVTVDSDRAAEWEAWMRAHHVQDVLDTGCFVHATMVRDEGADRDGQCAYRVAYVAPDEATFRRYQADHAAALQHDHTQRFDGCVSASREELPVIQTYLT